jgi:hypothetical protein
MGGVTDSIGGFFGGGGNGAGTQTSTVTLDPALTSASKDAITGAQDLFGQGTQGIFQDSRIADLDALITAGQQQQLSQIPSFTQQTQDLQTSFANLLANDPNDPLVQARINDFSNIVGDQFNRVILPGIAGGATSVGQSGSSRQGIAEGLASGEAATAIARGVNDLLANQQQTSLAASSVAPTIFSQQFMPGDIQSQIGQARTARDQAELQDFIQQFEAPRRAELQNLTEFTNLLRNNPLTGAVTTTATGTTAEGSPLQGILGTASTIGGLFQGGPNGGQSAADGFMSFFS